MRFKITSYAGGGGQPDSANPWRGAPKVFKSVKETPRFCQSLEKGTQILPIFGEGHPDSANPWRRAPRFCQSLEKSTRFCQSLEKGTQILPILGEGHPDSANPWRRPPRFCQSLEKGTQILPLILGEGHPDSANLRRVEVPKILPMKIEKPSPPVMFTEH